MILEMGKKNTCADIFYGGKEAPKKHLVVQEEPSLKVKFSVAKTLKQPPKILEKFSELAKMPVKLRLLVG